MFRDQLLKAGEISADVGADGKQPFRAEGSVQELAEGRAKLEGVANVRGEQANLPEQFDVRGVLVRFDDPGVVVGCADRPGALEET